MASETPKDESKPSESRNWYRQGVSDVGEEARDLLAEYSGYSQDDILKEVLDFREEAFKQYPYSCIGQMRFLLFNLRQLPFYDRVVTRLKSGATFLDAGCCFAQELRYIAHIEGVPMEQLHGFDLEDTFVNLGFKLYRDKDKLGGSLVTADVLAHPSAPKGQNLVRFDGSIDIVFCSSFLHVFPWDEMVSAAQRLVKLTEGREHAVICGKQLGSRKPGHYDMPTKFGRHYRHDENTLAELWKQVGRNTGTEWKVDAEFYEGIEMAENRNQSWSDANQSMIWFYVTKV